MADRRRESPVELRKRVRASLEKSARAEFAALGVAVLRGFADEGRRFPDLARA